MVKGSYNPSNKRFRDSFQRFAGTKTKKGNLNRGDKDIIEGVGDLIKVEKSKIEYPERGWQVNLNGTVYHLSFKDYTLPSKEDYTETPQFYVMKSTVKAYIKVNIKENERNIVKVYTVGKEGEENNYTKKDGNLKIKSGNAKSINLTNEKSTVLIDDTNVTLQNENNKLTLSDDNVSIDGDLVVNDVNISKEHEDNKDILNSNTIIPNSDSYNENGLTLDGLVSGYNQLKIDSENQIQINDSKQDVLKSGVNLKTINGQSLLGRGNVVIQSGGGGSTSSVQSDWNVTDSASLAYIRNKPQIPSKTSQLTNDSGFLTTHQSLNDYYTKSETNNQINTHHDDTKQDKSTLNEDVESLGYLKEHQSLDNYYTKTQTNVQIANYHDPTKVDKITGKTLSTNDYTTAEKNKLASLNNYDDTNIQANIQNLNNNKADKSELKGYKDIFYCSCSTNADVSEKILTTNDNFELREGVVIVYKPSITNVANNVTLNINNTGAKQIWYRWSIYSGSGNLFTGYKDVPIYYIYDGNYWVWIGASNDNDTITGTETTIEAGVNDTKFATRQSVRNYVDNHHDDTKADKSEISDVATQSQIEELESELNDIENNFNNFYMKESIDSFLDNKQDTLQSGVNIKTISDQTILGSGNIPIKTINNNALFGQSGNLDLAPKLHNHDNSYYTKTQIDNITSDIATQTWVGDQGYITEAPVISVNGQVGDITLTPSDLGLGNVFKIKGSKQTINDLPTTDNEVGDVWYIISESVGYIWLNDGTTYRWEQLGLEIDLSEYTTIDQLNNSLSDYVQKISGKTLSSNDFTDVLKNKLDGLENYDDSYLWASLQLLNENKQDNIEDLDNIINNSEKGATALQPNDDISKLNNDVGYLTQHQSLSDYYTKTQTNTQINNHHDSTKQDVISDLTTIRNGANKGSTAIQPNDDISKLNNDVGYLTSHQDLSGYYTKEETNNQINNHHDSLKQDVISDLTTIRAGANKGATSLQPVGTASQFLKADGSVDNNKYARIISHLENPNNTIENANTEGLNGELGDLCKDITNGKLYVLYKIEVI